MQKLRDMSTGSIREAIDFLLKHSKGGNDAETKKAVDALAGDVGELKKLVAAQAEALQALKKSLGAA